MYPLSTKRSHIFTVARNMTRLVVFVLLFLMAAIKASRALPAKPPGEPDFKKCMGKEVTGSGWTWCLLDKKPKGCPQKSHQQARALEYMYVYSKCTDQNQKPKKPKQPKTAKNKTKQK